MKTELLTQNRRKLWHSAEMAYVRSQLVECSVLYALLLLAAFFGSRGKAPLLALAVGMALCVLPELAACLWEAFCILHRPGDYIFCTTQLHDPSSVLLDRGSFTLTGVIDDADGSHIAVRTHPIFLSHGFGALRMEEYTDKTVTVGWNRKTDSVVVIG